MPFYSFLKISTEQDSEGDLLVFGSKERLDSDLLRSRLGIPSDTWSAMMGNLRPGDFGASTATYVGSRRILVGMLPASCSRHNTPSCSWAIPGMVSQLASRCRQGSILGLVERENAEATALAVARAIPLYSSKSKKKEVRFSLSLDAEGEELDIPGIQAAMDAVRYAAMLTDMPASELNVSRFVQEARDVAARTGTALSIVRGEELERQGFGGLWGVGKAAEDAPAFVTLEWSPEDPRGSVAWVGKGIVYDTGGLSIKSKTGMPGMKGDMAGAGAVLAAFEAAVKREAPYRLTAVLCLAENAIGPMATRPDDILVMKSGKTVEVNNTDAEGRLVLADGVSWAAKSGAGLVIDIATLTGAASVSVGKHFAALYCNDDAVETAAVVAGRAAGEPCHPLPYVPELFRREFASQVADMKNSVKDRANAQSSCAGQFIANHLPVPAPKWLHIDIAGPAWARNKRGTGYGVGLLLGLGAGPDPAFGKQG
jgi:probable aminopeptidase NPEPL1